MLLGRIVATTTKPATPAGRASSPTPDTLLLIPCLLPQTSGPFCCSLYRACAVNLAQCSFPLPVLAQKQLTGTRNVL